MIITQANFEWNKGRLPLSLWFPNFFLSRRILEKTEIIWRTSNIWIKNLFKFVIFSYPNVKSRQYWLSSQEI